MGYEFASVDENGLYSNPAFLHIMGAAEPFPPSSYLNPRSNVVHHQNPDDGRFSLCSRMMMDDFDRVYVYSRSQICIVCAKRLASS